MPGPPRPRGAGHRRHVLAAEIGHQRQKFVVAAAIVGGLVWGLITIAIIRYRRPRDARGVPPQIGALTWLGTRSDRYLLTWAIGLGLMIVGLGFKLSLVPFHLWTPDVYQGAPAPVSTFLATASKIAIFGVVMRLFLYMPVGNSEAVRVVLGLIAVSVTLTWLLAVLNDRMTRRFRDRVTVVLETHVATLQASVSGLEHQ